MDDDAGVDDCCGGGCVLGRFEDLGSCCGVVRLSPLGDCICRLESVLMVARFVPSVDMIGDLVPGVRIDDSEFPVLIGIGIGVEPGGGCPCECGGDGA